MSRIYMYNTGSYAKERLMNILISDRIGCSPDFVTEMRNAIKHEMDRYVDLDESDIDIQVKEKMLIAHVPLVCAKAAGAECDYPIDMSIHTGRGSEDYEASEEEGPAELKTIQS